MELTQEEKDRTLKNFMEEWFYFDGLVSIGFFQEEMRGDYKAQADKLCNFFGYESIFEYNTKQISVHLSIDGERPKGYESFTTTIEPWYNQ